MGKNYLQKHYKLVNLSLFACYALVDFKNGYGCILFRNTRQQKQITCFYNFFFMLNMNTLAYKTIK